MKTKKGFTLVELLVVIAILAILATATIVGFTAFTEKAKLSNLEGEMKQVTELLQLEDYYNGSFEITEEGISFREYYKLTGTASNQEVSWLTASAYNALTEAEKQDWTETEKISIIVQYSSDAELASYADRLSYSAGVLTLVNAEKDLKAEWNVATNEITSGKNN